MSTEHGKPPFFARLVHNWVSLSGLVLIASSWFAFCLLLVLDATAGLQSPYVGILTFLVAPMFFLMGIALWVVGWLLHRRRVASGDVTVGSTRFTIDISRQRDRRILAGFAGGTALFLLVTSIGSYETYHATKSVTFCGQACHAPMEPQYVAYQHSPHAQVGCTECHIGSGAANFVKAKFNGLHQVYATVSGQFEHPIRHGTGIKIDQSTCEQCHWPQRYVGDVARTYRHFLTEQTNTPFTVKLLLKVGGGDPTHGPVGGIHWHMNLANKVEYIATDPLKQVIPWVRLTDSAGVSTVYATRDFKDDPAKHRIHRMDCLDCHSRPAHQFRGPNDAVDLALATGRLDPALPFVKSNVVAALVQPYATRTEAVGKIASFLRATYAKHPQVENLIAEAQRLYQANLFPEMKADWRTHPNNLGHKDWPGCFRCHDGNHKTADGKRSIKASDCNSCHTILAQGSGEQLAQLNAQGHAFFHIDSVNEDFDCHSCHTGAFPKEP